MRHQLTTMLTRRLFVLALLLLGACDSAPSVLRSPTAPLPSPDPATQVRIAGRVIDDRGMAIAGASITHVVLKPETVVVTDADGFYELSAFRGTGLSLIASGPGYEPNYQWVPTPSADVHVQNFRLRDIVRITTGEVLSVRIDSDDTLYGSSEQFRARQVRVVVPAAGNLVVDGSSTSAGRRVLLSDKVFEYTPCCPARLVVPVSAAQELIVNVLTYWLDTPAEFVVTARLEPQ